MTIPFQELDRQPTDMGEVSLRRRWEPVLEVDVYEIKLGAEFLMSSLFTVAECELARLALARVDGEELDVLVGGLGLGYTARTALEDHRVRRLEVVDALAPVIDWHQQRVLPMAELLVDDPRCHLRLGDFFALVAGDEPDPTRYDAILLDIDHTPRHVLHPRHAASYTPEGLERIARRVRPGGVFGMWSDGLPDDAFVADLTTEFGACDPHVVTFPNPYTGLDAASTVYLAHAPR